MNLQQHCVKQQMLHAMCREHKSRQSTPSYQLNTRADIQHLLTSWTQEQTFNTFLPAEHTSRLSTPSYQLNTRADIQHLLTSWTHEQTFNTFFTSWTQEQTFNTFLPAEHTSRHSTPSYQLNTRADIQHLLTSLLLLSITDWHTILHAFSQQSFNFSVSSTFHYKFSLILTASQILRLLSIIRDRKNAE